MDCSAISAPFPVVEPRTDHQTSPVLALEPISRTSRRSTRLTTDRLRLPQKLRVRVRRLRQRMTATTTPVPLVKVGSHRSRYIFVGPTAVQLPHNPCHTTVIVAYQVRSERPRAPLQ